MKDLKFRAWVEKWKEMREVYTIKWEDNSVFIEVDQYCPFFKIDEIKLMQYTGLKDYKGRELYEGDIIECFIEGDGINRGDIQFDYGVFGIEWADFKDSKTLVGTWGQKHNLKRLDTGIIDELKIEIIGNIYQNPELLEEHRIKEIASFYIAPNPEKGQK